MTGQVKEEVLTRFGELGLRVSNGCVSLSPGLLPLSEVVPHDNAGTLLGRFTFCSVTMTVARGELDGVDVVRYDGTRSTEMASSSRPVSRRTVRPERLDPRVEWTIGPRRMTLLS